MCFSPATYFKPVCLLRTVGQPLWGKPVSLLGTAGQPTVSSCVHVVHYEYVHCGVLAMFTGDSVSAERWRYWILWPSPTFVITLYMVWRSSLKTGMFICLTQLEFKVTMLMRHCCKTNVGVSHCMGCRIPTFVQVNARYVSFSGIYLFRTQTSESLFSV